MSPEGPTTLTGNFARVELKTYAAELPLATLTVGVDNIHHDVYLSPIWTEHTRVYLLEFIRQVANLTYSVRKGSRPPKGPETGAWKRQTLELMQASLTRAKYEKKIELDLLFRAALLKFLTQEIGAQFASLLLEAKEWIRSRGEYFERSEQAHIMKARLAELQAQAGGPMEAQSIWGAGARLYSATSRKERMKCSPTASPSSKAGATTCSFWSNTFYSAIIRKTKIASRRSMV